MNDVLYIPKNIVGSVNTSDNGVLATVVLSCYYRNSKLEEIISIKATSQFVCGSFDKRFMDSLRDGIKELEEKKYININWSDNDRYIIDMAPLEKLRAENYIILRTIEFIEIYRSGSKSRNSVLRCCLSIFGHWNVTSSIGSEYKGKICTISQNRLADSSGKDVRTFRKCLDYLEKIGIIYIARMSRHGKCGDDKKGLNNFIARSCDKDLCDSIASEGGKTINIDESNVSNMKRRYKQIYNQLAAGNYNYEPDVVDEVKNYIESLNHKNKEKYDIDPFYRYYETI